MATRDRTTPSYLPSGKGKKFGIVVSEWNSEITNKLLEGAKETFVKSGATESEITVVHVPGSFELPLGASLLIESAKYDGIVCLGAVIKGETEHDRFINAAVAEGIMRLNIAYKVPVAFGVLTTNDVSQAEERAGGKHGNKGAEAAETILNMMDIKNNIQNGSKTKMGF